MRPHTLLGRHARRSTVWQVLISISIDQVVPKAGKGRLKGVRVSTECQKACTSYSFVLFICSKRDWDEVLQEVAVLLRLATTTTEVLELYCHVFLVGVALGVSMHKRTYAYVLRTCTHYMYVRVRLACRLAEMSAQEDEWTAIVVLCADGRPL